MVSSRRFSEILNSGEQNRLQQAWDNTQAADEFDLLPKGDYDARLTSGEPFEAPSTGNLGYKLMFVVTDGDHEGRRIWHTLWLTPNAMAWTKRDLKKLGIDSINQLDDPLPRGIVCRLRVVIRKNDDGTEYNEVRRMEVVRIELPEDDPFAPVTPPPSPSNEPPTAEEEIIEVKDQEFLNQLEALAPENQRKGI
jgi:hypothetical protein